MVKIYVARIRAGKMTIDEVPERWCQQVREALSYELVMSMLENVNSDNILRLREALEGCV